MISHMLQAQVNGSVPLNSNLFNFDSVVKNWNDTDGSPKVDVWAASWFVGENVTDLN